MDVMIDCEITPSYSGSIVVSTVLTLHLQVYRSVLLNNGPRHKPKPDTSTTSEDAPTGASGSADEAASSKDTPIDQLLYKPEIEVGSRGDIIQFYNKIFIGFIKDFVLKFSPNEQEVRVEWR